MQSVTELGDGLVMISASEQGPSELDLSRAEREVLELALRGPSNQVFLAVRGCSTRSIANQLASVYQRLSVSGRRELPAKSRLR